MAFSLRPLLTPVLAMGAVVFASNLLVQYPFRPFGLADYLTWGAFTYPFAFLITDLTNRRLGAGSARRVVYVGFALAVVLSILFAGPRIALASGSAFLAAQLLDVAVFDRLRGQAWWRAPLVSSLVGAALDTALFFSLAFAGDPGLASVAYAILGGAELPVWAGWAASDFLVKIALAGLMLGPYRALLRRGPPLPAAAAG